MVEVNLVGIMVGDMIVNKVFFPGSMSLEIEIQKLQKKWGNKVRIQPIILVDDKNVYNPLGGGKHAQFSSDLAYSKLQIG